MKRWLLIACLPILLAPAQALAWGFEGHEVIADIARAYMTPAVLAKVDAMLAADQDTLTPHDMASEATWADRYRTAHRETAAWHFADIELDRPDMAAACFGYPTAAVPASAGPANDCVVDRMNAFAAELAMSGTPPAERLLALKFVLHFVGDIHQPLHAADNHDRGGNCVLLAQGGPQTVNLHAYWDTSIIQAMGEDPAIIAAALVKQIKPADKATWEKGNARTWAMESFTVAKTSVYTIGSKPGCASDQAPVSLPAGYDRAAQMVAAIQLERGGVRLALVLNQALGS